MANPRLVALEALNDILERKIYADEALSSAFESRKLNKKDKALATELIYGVTRNKLAIDFLISKISKRELRHLSFNLRNILRLGVYQLEYTRIPEYAAVNSTVELCKIVENTKVSTFVNGILRNLIKQRPAIKFPKISRNRSYALSIKFSHPKWVVKRWLDNFGLDNTMSLLSFNNTSPQVTININRIKASYEEVLNELEEVHIHPTPSTISPQCLKIGNAGLITQIPGFYEGHWFVQDELSSLVVDILSPQEGETIIDLCAAPGIKTVQSAGYMNNKGKIYAIDIKEDRIKRIKQNCYRLGVNIIECIHDDGTTFTMPENNLADKILIDAPCSNTGVFNKRADARWHRRKSDLVKLPQTQLKLLNNATKLLKQSGIMVYSVCSIEPEEGIEVINKFLDENKNFELLDIKNFLPDNLKETFETRYALFLPFEHLTDGFFIASVKKLY
jgi:16S rRNA (cytosine967-C5)-methyltransferase